MHLLLEPHLDDGTLFSALTILRHRPQVVTVCSRATVQERYGITNLERLDENQAALDVLGVSVWDVLDISDERPDWSLARERLRPYFKGISTLWLPWPEEGGHDQHNAVADLGLTMFPGEIRYYATYRRGSARTRTENETVPEPHWPALKFKAMACYTSQINLPNCQPWFAADDCLREWTA